MLCGALTTLGCNATFEVGESALSGGAASGPGPQSSSSTADADGSQTTSTAGAAETTAAADDGSGPRPPIFDVDPGDIPPVPVAPEFPQTCKEAEEGTTSVGCEFYPYVPPTVGVVSYNAVGFMVTNVSSAPAAVLLSDRDGVVQSANIAPGQIHTFAVEAPHQTSLDTQIAGNSYVLTSNEVVQMFEFYPLDFGIDDDAGLVLPATALGTRHRVATYNGGSGYLGGQQYISVVAVEDQTEITVTLGPSTIATLAGGGVPALDVASGNDTTAVVLDRLEVLTIAASGWDGSDLTGTLVDSDRPVAVYSGASATYVPAVPGPWDFPGGPDTIPPGIHQHQAGDLLFDAIPPTTVWGTQYAGVKFMPLGQEPDVWRLMADTDGTEITLSGDVTDVFTLDAGEFVDLQTPGNFWAHSADAFALVHYMTSAALVDPDVLEMRQGSYPTIDTHDCGLLEWPGDPAMTWAYPVGNWLRRYVFPVGQQGPRQASWCHDHVTIVAPAERWGDVMFDGLPLPPGEPLGDSPMDFVRIPGVLPAYELVAPAGVGVELTVYGYRSSGSYAYPGGLGLQTLNPAG